MFLELHESATGTKARSLTIADQYGVSRPEGFTVSGEVLLSVVPDLDDQQTLLRQIDSDGLSARKHVEAFLFRRLLESPVLDHLAAKAASLSNKVAVRSSFAFEDDPNLTFAGIFESELPVDVSKDKLCAAIVRVWASACSRRFLDGAKTKTKLQDLHILIHEYLEFEWLGVSFSRDPTNQLSDVTVVEVSNSAKTVVSGGEHGVHSYIVYDDGTTIARQPEDSAVFPEAFLKDVVLLTRSVANHYEDGADLEWGITKSGTLYKLQSRGIAINTPTAGVDDGVLSFDDDDIRSVRVSRNYKKIINWYWDKRRLSNKVSADVGVAFQRYVLASAEKLLSNSYNVVSQLRQHLGTDRFLVKLDSEDVMSNDSSVIVSSNAVVEVIRNAKRQNKISEWVVFKSFFEADASGLSSKVGENYMLEVAPGDIGAVLQGSTQVSVFTCQSDGTLITSSPRIFSSVSVFDPDTVATVSYDVAPFLLDIRQDARVKIAELTRGLAERFGECRVEWMLCGDKVVFYDLSVEKGELHQAVTVNAEEIVMSPGCVSAPLLVLTEQDMDVLRSTVSGRLSVISDVSELSDLERITQEGHLSALISRNNGKKVIISAPYPDLNLVPLIPIASGFIFKAGAILSHFGIILRQSGIPAVIRPNWEQGKEVHVEIGASL